MCDSYTPSLGFEPATHTVASGRSSATEWYIRAYASVPAGDHVSDAGSNRSARSVAVVASLCVPDPPIATILPVGSITAFMSMRGPDIDGSERHVGEGTERSM